MKTDLFSWILRFFEFFEQVERGKYVTSNAQTETNENFNTVLWIM